MSGGYFNYKQRAIAEIVNTLRDFLKRDDLEEDDYPPAVLYEIRLGLYYITMAYIYAQRIDWLVSCDDGPDTFLTRLQEDMESYNRAPENFEVY